MYIRESIVIAELNPAINSPKIIIKLLNEKFGVDFVIPVMSPNLVKNIFNKLKIHNFEEGQSKLLDPTPDFDRSLLKKEIKVKIKNNFHFNKGEQLYNQYLTYLNIDVNLYK